MNKERMNELTDKALSEDLPSSRYRSRWTSFLPLVDILVEQRNFTVSGAVDWLIDQKEISSERRLVAIRSICAVRARRAKRNLDASAHPQAV